MLITANRNDKGIIYPVSVLSPAGPGYIPAAELAVGSFVLKAFRHDSTRVALSPSSSDSTIQPHNRLKFHLYKLNDIIRIDDEEMTISGTPDTVNYQFTVTRAVIGQEHRRGSRIRHLVAESPTSVTWDNALNRLQLELELAFTEYTGTYELEIEVTSGTKIYNVTMNQPQDPMRLQVLDGGV